MIAHPFIHSVAAAPPAVARLELPGLPLFARGKVREMYDLGEHLLMVATDRLSAFDVVLDEPIPGKGIVLSALSAFWFRRFGGPVPNHFVSDDPEAWPEVVRPFADVLRGRALLVRRCRRVDVECVVRGYLAGAGWAEYRRDGTLGGVPLPSGLREADRLPEPRFTPTTKAEEGHDRPLEHGELVELVGSELAAELERRSLELYTMGAEHARERGVIVADTKFEFGLLDGQLLQIDECLTPDSSRFWPADSHEPGQTPPSLDKQPIRDYLERLGWDKRPPPPPLPPKVVAATTERYREALVRLTGVGA